MRMTHDDLVQSAVRWLRSTHRCPIVYAELVTTLPMTPDAIGMRPSDRWSVLVECKRTRSDFRADLRKAWWGSDRVPGQERWYLTPEGLLSPGDLPEWGGFGLAEVVGSGRRRQVQVVHRPERSRHGRRWPYSYEREAARTEAEWVIQASALRRLHAGDHYDRATGRFRRRKDGA